MLYDLPATSSRPLPAGSGVDATPGPARTSAPEPLQDTIEIGRAVGSPDPYGAVRLDTRPDDQGQPATPSLGTILEAIQKYIEEALAHARQEDAEFSKRLDAFQKKLEDVKGAENQRSADDREAAAAPVHREDFTNAAARLLFEAHEKEAQHPAGSVPVNPNVELSDLQLHTDPQDPKMPA